MLTSMGVLPKSEHKEKGENGWGSGEEEEGGGEGNIGWDIKTKSETRRMVCISTNLSGLCIT